MKAEERNEKMEIKQKLEKGYLGEYSNIGQTERMSLENCN